ncbi:MAG: biopolymer transporter ExbD [Planctomycetes bacterium]|nr:biopolymer transporter ExbD [Planctomycetota bacterium]
MSRHSHKNPGSPGVQLGLIITPMLDMSFQILAFFIMTYNPSALEGHIPGSLVPPADVAKKSKDNNNSPAPVDPLSIPEDQLNPELDSAVTVKVRAVVKGQESEGHPVGSVRQMLVQTSLDTSAEIVSEAHHDFKDALKLLDERLKKMTTSKTNLKIAPDGDLRQEYVMVLYDACKNAGYSKVHFVPPPVLNTKLNKK